MAESLVLPVVRGVVSKAADALIKKVTAMWGIDGDRHKLERHLVYVQSLLTDAEVKSETNHAVRMWMKELKAAAYQADDVLDDFQYEALRREALSDQSMTSKVLSNFTSKNRLVFRYKASRDLKKVLDKINELVAEMNTFGLVVLKEAPTMQALPRQTHSALDESMEIFGRDDDKEVVVKLLLEQQDRQDVQVLPITGMGGVGKTTLAKMVYNNRKIQKHFELKMWHCVSENFEAIPLVRSVIELATNSRCDLPDTIELLRGRLQEAIGRKRFLLILDDVWNENPNKWEDGLKPLLCSIGGSGSMIVVTARSPRVALIMGTLPTHELACLSEDDSWELFSKKAFSKGVQEEADLVRIGKRISNKCKGLPLALKTMGGLMSSKQKVQEWEAIADCTISDTSRGKNEVLSILKLSYNHLPPEMKQCFAFCAFFPKDYKIEKDMLIQLWMANGYIQEEGTMDLAQKGEFVFNELAWRSFLQDVISMRNYGRYDHSSKSELNCCIMHDLMHDLAKDVANECATSEELIQQKVSINGVCHLQILGSHLWDEIKQLLRDSIYLRTLLSHEPLFWYHQDLLKSKLMPSRALRFDYRGTAIVHRQLTHAAHLRYLDLSESDIVSLPNSLCTMYNLQTLRLNNCSKLVYLPEGMRTMRKLSHIYLLGCCSLEWMPPKLSQLHNLRTLTTFVVDTQDGCGIEELEGLQQLGNRLELYNLKKVKCGSKVNLHEKQNLNELLLYWGRTCQPDDKPTIDDANNHEQVLESLVPHGELKTLEVHGYGGLTISKWMRNPQMFRCLRELVMSNCPWCKDLPMVWLSSSLEHLSLSFMESLTTLYKKIDVEDGETSRQIVPKLKRMELIQLPELENNSSVIFPQLEKLEIEDCDKLSSLPETPVLTDLQLTYSGKKGSLSICMPLGRFSSLVRLQIQGLLVDVVLPPDDQQSQSQSPLDTLRYLWLVGENSFISIFNKSKLKLGLQDCFVLVEELDISSCSNIVRWPVEELRCFPRLRSLHFSSCSKLEGNGSSCEEEEILPLPQLERLEIYSCDSLLQIPKLPISFEKISIRGSRSLAALPSNLGDLAKLRILFVWNCVALKVLPDGMDGLTSLERLSIAECPEIEKFPQGLLQRLPALKSLAIWNCPDLQRRCREGGEYFDLVASIPYKIIPAPAPAPERKKAVKWLLPSCGGSSQGN